MLGYERFYDYSAESKCCSDLFRLDELRLLDQGLLKRIFLRACSLFMFCFSFACITDDGTRLFEFGGKMVPLPPSPHLFFRRSIFGEVADSVSELVAIACGTPSFLPILLVQPSP